jgi:hypothetical protein
VPKVTLMVECPIPERAVTTGRADRAGVSRELGDVVAPFEHDHPDAGARAA